MSPPGFNRKVVTIGQKGARQDSSSRKERSEGIAAGRGPPRGGVTAAQFTSIWFNLVRDGLDFRHLVEPGEEVLGQLAFGRRRFSCRPMGQREADDSAVARQRGPRKHCFVSMRGNDSKNESRLKSYGRFLNRFIPPQCRKAVLRSFLRRLGIQFAARQFVPGRGESDERDGERGASITSRNLLSQPSPPLRGGEGQNQRLTFSKGVVRYNTRRILSHAPFHSYRRIYVLAQ